MCGIIGYIGEKKAAPLLIEGLKRLEYRGYDSAGISTIDKGNIFTKKGVGKIDEIDKIMGLKDVDGNVGICHCRWATHGSVTQKNAHPHSDSENVLSIVHNGIIENYSELKRNLIEKGYLFSSETDSEVAVNLISSYYKDDLKEAVIKALRDINGSYAFGIISSKQPNLLIAARNESPLIIGLGDKENFIASDVPAILKYAKDVIYLDNKEVAVIKRDSLEIFNLDGKKVNKEINKINWSAEQAEKLGFDHFMLKEIFEQVRVIGECIDGRIGDESINLREEINLSEDEIRDIKRIIIVACGTSWHAALIGEFMLEELAKIPVEVEYASEFRYRDPIIDPNTLIIAISQSGETADTLAAIREAKKKNAKIISIVNAYGSSIARESNIVIYTKAGPEIGVASTKAFTTQLIVLYLMTVYFGDVRGHINKQQVRNRIRDLRLIPLQIETILEDKKYIDLFTKKFYLKTNALYLGRGINYPIALEGALKLKEVSYIHAEGYPAAEMKHGPIALIDKEMPVIVIATQDNRTYTKVLNNIQEVKARGGIIIAIATKGDEEIKNIVDYLFYIPKNSYILNPVLAVIPLQIFAYNIALMRGKDPDHPVNLAKSVTVE